MLKRRRRRRQHSGEGGESAGCLGTPPPAPAGGRRAQGGVLGWGRGAGTPRAGGSDVPAPGFACSVTRPPRGPGPRLQRRASSHIPAHIRASPCTLHPGRARAPGEGSARGAEEGAPQARSPGKIAPLAPVLSSGLPQGNTGGDPLKPPSPAPPSVPHCSQPIPLPGRGRGCCALLLKGPLPFLSPGRSRARVGWGVPTGPRPPRPPRPAPEPQPGRRARGTRRTLPRAFFSHPGLPGRRVEQEPGGLGRPPSAGAVGGADPRPGEQPHWSQAQGLGRSWERRGPAGRRRGSSRLARASWVTGLAWPAGKK